ncbi:MAG: fructosamine kinase family protein [Beutenbergiaceae bacterium]
MPTFIKTDFPHPEAARSEAAGLAWLALSNGARVVPVVSVEPGRLVLERIDDSWPTPQQAWMFGAALARTHAAGAPSFGYVPGDTGLYMGRLCLPSPDPVPTTWGAFYADHRLLPYLRRCVDQGRITADGQRTIERVLTRLFDGELEHAQPALVPAVARLHGDLWNGNVLWPRTGTAVLIDPTAHGGHAESDLAMLALFGAPHLSDIVAGYQEESALAAGWRDRIALHQLNPLLVHTLLFGGSYAQSAVDAAAPYA